MHLALLVVVEDVDQGIVAALVAHPPVSALQQIGQAAADDAARWKLHLAGGIGLARLRAVVVREEVRGQGIGALPVNVFRDVYARCGYLIIYGQMPPTPGLDEFYRRRGFDALNLGAGWDSWVVTGIHAEVRPDDDERMFIWRRPR